MVVYLESELKSKIDVLRYLGSNGIPIPKIYGTIDLGILVKDKPERLMLRSNLYGDALGFEGIFDSHPVKFCTKEVERYCQQKGLNIDEVLSSLKLMIQEYTPYPAIGRLYEHPNVPNRYFIVSRVLEGDEYSFAPEPIKMYVNREEHFKISVWNKSHVENKDALERLENRIEEIITLYDDVHALPKIKNSNSVWEMEFGAGLGIIDIDFHVLDLKLFRKKEISDYQIDTSRFNPKKSIITDIVFGVTTPEGNVMKYLRTTGDLGTKYVKILEAAKDEDLLIISPHSKYHFIPPNTYGKIKGMVVSSYGILEDHTSFRTAKDIPIILFTSRKLHTNQCQISNWLSDKSDKTLGSLTPYRVYSDGKMAVIEKI